MGRSRRPNSIRTRGDEVPKPIDSFKTIFERFGIAQHLKDAVKRSGFKAPTAVQSQVIPLMMDRREIICSAPTGSGKTLAFVLPMIHQLKEPKRCGSFRGLILAPTRELAKQIHREILWLSEGSNLKAHHLKDVKEAAKKFNPESLYKYDILVTTPNRLSKLLSTEPPSISLRKLQWLIIDECDRIFDMGFKDDLTIIYKHCLESDECKRAMFSATLEKNLVEWAELQMTNVVTVIVGKKNLTNTNVEQELIYVGNESGKVISLRELITSGIQVPVLIFVDAKEKARKLAQEFLYDDINIDFIHSERDQKDRDAIITRFREGKIWFLVCSDLMCRGIDFKGVNVVVNYDCPQKIVSYIHRVGRTGRAGRKGKAITFISDSDKKILPHIIKVMRKSGCIVPKTITDLLTKTKTKKSKPNKIDEKQAKTSKNGHKPVFRKKLKIRN